MGYVKQTEFTTVHMVVLVSYNNPLSDNILQLYLQSQFQS